MLGLGCENNQVSALKEEIGEWNDDRVKFLIAQEVEDEVETGVAICKELIEKMKGDKRQPLPVSHASCRIEMRRFRRSVGHYRQSACRLVLRLVDCSWRNYGSDGSS